MELITTENNQNKTLSSSEKSNSLLIHLSSFANLILPFGNIILPLILWQTMKKDSEFIDYNGKEAVNFNISFLLYNIIAILVLIGSVLGTVFSGVSAESGNAEDIIPILFSTGGFIVTLVLLSVFTLVKIVLVIIASIKTNNGELHRYPLIIRFIK
jgi:uncharacterized Tic20 family protein